MKRLPEYIKMICQAREKDFQSCEELAAFADTLTNQHGASSLPEFQFQEEVEGEAYALKSPLKNLCGYHAKFGKEAQRCTGPWCMMYEQCQSRQSKRKGSGNGSVAGPPL